MGFPGGDVKDERAKAEDESEVPSALGRADARRNRESILVAAHAELCRSADASMDRIAATAGVSRSTLYRHFPSRDDLLAAVKGRKATGAAGPSEESGARDARLLRGGGGEGFVLAAPPGASDLKDAGLAEVRPPGQLGRAAPLVVDATHVLNEVPPHLVPEQIVAEAGRIAGVPVALYVIDVDGAYLRRLAGSDEFPPALEGPLAVGPEIAPDALPDLYDRLEAALPDCHPYPMWLRGRAIGVLIAVRRPRESLADIARQGTAALELANLYTDDLEVARRRVSLSAAAEVQVNLLPPRNAQVAGGELAGSLLPSYKVGGDWFDYAENRDGTWLAVADTVGSGVSAAALSAVAFGALRAARRSASGLEEAVAAMDGAVRELDARNFHLAAVVARWHAPSSTFGWIACGEAAPLLIYPDASYQLLRARRYPPLGRTRAGRAFERRERRLHPGERIVLCSGGVPERKTTGGGELGLDGLAAAVKAMGNRSAAATARAIQEAVATASEDPLEEDAAVVVLAVH